MAAIELDPTSKRYRIRFRLDGREYKRSIRTTKLKEARSILGRVEETIALIERGRIEMPPEADPGTFVLSDGKRNGKPAHVEIRTLRELFDRYENSLLTGVKEPTTLKTERIHLRHFRRLLKTSRPIASFTVAVMQEYVESRLKERCGEKTIAPDTVKKEIATFRAIWNWAVEQELLQLRSPTKGIKYPKRNEKPPFMTWAEIERRIGRGGLTEAEEKELWEALFLTTSEVGEVIDHVRENAHHPFILPMILFAAHTGARCSELLRAQIDDFDFTTNSVRIREKKRSCSRSITFRHIPLTDVLANAMQEWFAAHPGGQHVIVHANADSVTPDEARHYFKQVFARSRWKRLRGFHVFRHSFASNLASAGVDQRIIDDWMGHQTEEMRRRYRHLLPDTKQAAILKLLPAS